MSKLKQKLEDYKIDPFGSGAARHITTGKELDHQVVTDMLRAPDIGSNKYKQFVEDRLVKQTLTVDFFQPIKKLKLRTGLSKQTKQPRKVSVLKEDRQDFGDLLSKSIDIEEAMQYPLLSHLLLQRLKELCDQHRSNYFVISSLSNQKQQRMSVHKMRDG